MADNEQYNDEYQFADLDAMSPDAGDESGLGNEQQEHLEEGQASARATDKNDIKRKALFVVGLVILIMVMYKVVGSMFSGKKGTAGAPSVAAVAQNPPPPSQPQPVAQAQPQSVIPQPQVDSTTVDTKVSQKLAVLESTQQSMRSDVTAVSDQIGGIGKNMDAIVAKLTEMNGIIANLNAKVEEQSKEIEQLTIQRTEAKRVHRPVHKEAASYLKYYLQAVIPGRAWLIATNGTTLTVREGTIIAGYGMVKLIDPNQGRVTTSSGQVIRFSQEDS